MNALPDLRAIAAEAKAAARIADVIGETLALRRNGRHMLALCPFHCEKTPSFCVYSDHFHCFGCGAHGDVIDWLMNGRGMTFREAVAHLGGTLQRDPPCHPAPARKVATRQRSATAAVFMRCWDEGRDPAGTTVEAYLRRRGGLAVPDDAPIRFHPRCQRGPRDLIGGPEFWPAMLALMTNPISGEPVGLHRTYLPPDGSGKAPQVARVAADGATVTLKAKMIIGTWGVVRLVPDEEVGRGLGITEGIENALSVMQRIGWAPVWAAGTRGSIAGFPVLPWAEAITVFADADDSGVGIDAARTCAARWTEAGREAVIQVPPAGQDWNDAVQRVAA